jgi:anti-anti-sigma regulatory factor
MTSDSLNGPRGRGKANQPRVVKAQTEPGREHAAIDVERSGDWMPVDELREAALVAMESGSDVTLNLDRIDHLDASALQIMLALGEEQKQRGRNLQLANASPHLRQWFEFAGAAGQFSLIHRESNE